MKLAAIKPGELAIVQDDLFIPVGSILPSGSSMIDLIAAYDHLEEQLRLSLTLSGGDPTVFIRQPIAAALLLLTMAVLVAPAVRAARRGRVPDR